MAKQVGLSINRGLYQGRVMGQPTVAGEWARFMLKTIVPEQQNGQWVDQEVMVPFITNNPKTVETIKKFVQDERQLYLEGYTQSWQHQQGHIECAVKITLIKLGSKTMYDPEANNQGGGGHNQGGGNFPA